MGYRMEYGTGNDDAVFYRVGNGRKVWAAGIIIGALLLTCCLQRERIINLLLPGDPDATRKAIRVFVNELKEGERATEAFAAFCKVIVDEAEFS